QNPQASGTNRLMLRTNDGSEINSVSSFGEDNLGRLYITEIGTGTAADGELFRLVPAMPGDANGDFVVDRRDFMTLYNNYGPGVADKPAPKPDAPPAEAIDNIDTKKIDPDHIALLKKSLGGTGESRADGHVFVLTLPRTDLDLHSLDFGDIPVEAGIATTLRF